MVSESFQNPIKKLLEFCIDFLSMLAPFWLPKLVQDGKKNGLENVSKNPFKNHWKMEPKRLPKWRYPYSGAAPFWALFLDFHWIGFFKVPRAPRGSKMNDFGSQNGAPKLQEWWPESPSRHWKCKTSERCLKGEVKYCRVKPKTKFQRLYYKISINACKYKGRERRQYGLQPDPCLTILPAWNIYT